MNESTQTIVTSTPPKPRGFAAMTPEKRSEISRKGGRAAHATGKAHRFTSEEARLAGRKGGLAPHASRGPRPVAADLAAE